MDNAKILMTGMKPNNTTKLDIVILDKTCPGEKVIPEVGLYRYLYWYSKQRGDQKRRYTNFILS